MLHVIRRIFLVSGAIALVFPSLSSALFACALPTAHTESVAPAVDRNEGGHGGGHAPSADSRPEDHAARVDGLRLGAGDAHSSCAHPCPDPVTCIAGASCAGAPTVAELLLSADAGNRPRQGVEPWGGASVPSRRDAPALPPPRL